MRKNDVLQLIGLFLVLLLSGCIVRTYPLVKDRVDQDLTLGNRGYLKGDMPSEGTEERKMTRTTRVVEIELHPPIKFEARPKTKIAQARPAEFPEKTQDQEAWGNRGYITQSQAPEIAEPAAGLEKYKVQKGDTLQKISQKFYGTTKKWNKIYQANRDNLKTPNNIYPGQVIDIPAGEKVKSLKEPRENLK
ncbi:MAG: LysM peptidoglycan-binding domain-containing protein [Candidatus Omnitrophica bacterium]|nr:LysM peptidoglycan-binding domain-containing protein [Candidatus Omnitrophota bacterium]